jgi:hypothetical protein
LPDVEEPLRTVETQVEAEEVALAMGLDVGVVVLTQTDVQVGSLVIEVWKVVAIEVKVF